MCVCVSTQSLYKPASDEQQGLLLLQGHHHRGGGLLQAEQLLTHTYRHTHTPFVVYWRMQHLAWQVLKHCLKMMKIDLNSLKTKATRLQMLSGCLFLSNFLKIWRCKLIISGKFNFGAAQNFFNIIQFNSALLIPMGQFKRHREHHIKQPVGFTVTFSDTIKGRSLWHCSGV